MFFSNAFSLSWLLINIDREMLGKSQNVVMNGIACLVSVCNNKSLHLKFPLKCLKADCTMGFFLISESLNTLHRSNEVSGDGVWHTLLRDLLLIPMRPSSHPLWLSESVQTTFEIVLGDFIVCFLLSQQTERIRRAARKA